MKRALLLVALLALLFVSAAFAVNPKGLVIQKSDLSAKFQLVSTARLSNATVVKKGGATAAELAKWGRVDGYQVVYSLNPKKTTAADLRGVMAINSSASVYRTSSGAHAAFLKVNAGLRAALPKGARAVSVLLGNETKAYSYITRANGFTHTSFAFSWRSGHFTEGMLCVGLKGGISKSQALAVAKKQQAHAIALG